MGAAVVAYTDPQGVLGRHQAQVEQYLRHLTNLRWRPMATSLGVGESPALRTVPHLSLDIIPEGTRRHDFQHQIPGLNNSPTVQLLAIETASLDIYRSKLRQIGRDWYQKQVQVREPTGYIVIHFVGTNDTPKATKAIWSRLNTEFDAAHVIQVNPHDVAHWKGLRQHMQQELLNAFGARLEMLQGELERLQATKDVPGWNFGMFFVLNESIAWAYESLNLLEDALRIYESLAVMVDGIPRPQWPSKTQSPLNKLVEDRGALVEPMLRKTASYFDIQRHLVVRQAELLFSMAASRKRQEEQVDSLSDKLVIHGQRLLLAKFPLLVGTLKEAEGSAKAYTWLLNVVRELFALVAEYGSSKLAQGKGDIVLVERDVLQAIANLKGWHIPGVFNDITLTDNGEAKDIGPIPELEDEESLNKEFLRLTNQAISYFRVAKMTRAVTQLIGQLVLMKYHQQEYQKVWDLIEGTPSLLKVSPQQYTLPAVLDAALDCAEKLKLDHDVLGLAWQILEVSAYGTISPRLAKQAIAAIDSLGSLEPRVQRLDNWFSVNLVPYLRADENGYYLDLALVPKNANQPFLAMTEAELMATVVSESGPSGKQIAFRASSFEALSMKLYAKKFVLGTISIEHFELRLGKQRLVHDFPETLCAMRPLSTALTVQAKLAKHHSIRKRNVEIKITSPKTIMRAKVFLQAADQRLQLLTDKAKGFDSLTRFQSAIVSVPALVDHENPTNQLRVIVEYDEGRSYELLEQLDFSLGVSVDFQEHFRQPPYILLQFLVQPINPCPATFFGAELSSSSEYVVNADYARSHRVPELIAYSGAPISYVFRIEKVDDNSVSSHGVRNSSSSSGSAEKMTLGLSYRSMLWECTHLLYTSTLASLNSIGLGCYSPTLGHVAQQVATRVDFAHYLATGILQVDKEVVTSTVNGLFSNMDPSHAARVVDHMWQALTDGVKRGDNYEEDFKPLSSTMELDVPGLDAKLVHYVDLELDSVKRQCVVGEAIPAKLHIQTIGFQDSNYKELAFMYELDRLTDGWSFTGKSKGVFSGGDDVMEPLSLIPNRSGGLLLPNVSIRAVSEEAEDHSVDSIDADEQDEPVIVSKHANSRVLVVPELNMLAITF